MTSTDHYLEAERMLEHAATMAAENVAPEDVPELLQRQALAVNMAVAHGLLAAAAAIGLSAKMGVADESVWRETAGTRLTDAAT
jgi:hypothetical protein